MTIGTRSVVGAHSFIRRDIPPYSIAVGCPAKVIGRVEITGNSDVRFVYEK